MTFKWHNFLREKKKEEGGVVVDQVVYFSCPLACLKHWFLSIVDLIVVLVSNIYRIHVPLNQKVPFYDHCIYHRLRIHIFFFAVSIVLVESRSVLLAQFFAVHHFCH